MTGLLAMLLLVFVSIVALIGAVCSAVIWATIASFRQRRPKAGR